MDTKQVDCHDQEEKPSTFLEVDSVSKPNPLLITKKAIRSQGVVLPDNPPQISRVDASGLLGKVKDFLPKMKEADEKLKETIKTPDGQEAVQIENVEDDQNYVEMNIGLVEQANSDEWSEDSDPDSPPSPTREDHNNGFTSDTDSDSTISTSTGSSRTSSSASSRSGSRPQIKKNQSKANTSRPKRPLIEDVSKSDDDKEQDHHQPQKKLKS